MAKIEDGGPAFPQHDLSAYDAWSTDLTVGMTTRDYFAAHADISGFGFTDYNRTADALGIDPPENHSGKTIALFITRVQAKLRYMIADAMIAERKGGE